VDGPDRAARLAAYEHRFRRAGLPLLSEDFSARSDVFNRAFPLLALVLLAELLAALDVDWSPLANAAAVAGALAVTLLAVALVNRARGRHALTIPEDVGTVELTLRGLQRANVGLVLLIGHGLQIVVVTLAIGAFFVAFGTIAIDADVTRAWLGNGTSGNALFSITVLDVPLRPTTELLRVSGAIAALSGVYYAISVLTDDRYREEFLDEITAQLNDTFAARTEYLELRASARAPERP
jgi:uncharacterized membrane protein HdeD (DUF308 family)